MQYYDKYTFFYGGPFSQWRYSPFEIDNQFYTHAEQYMMYQKAMVFGDLEAAKAVLVSKDPSIQKAIGRTVRGFNPDVWNSISRDVVFRANVAKFGQSKVLMHELMGTSGTLLVEASPTDKIWGIGLNEIQAYGTTPQQWQGTNWLGQVITEVREYFEFANNTKYN
jgi:hypothetical protein